MRETNRQSIAIMRRFAVVIALLSPAVSLASLEWEKELSWPIPEPYHFTSKAKDASGNVFFAGDREYASGLWKFSPDGKLAYERKLAIAVPHQVEVGTHEDIFLHGEEIVRVSRASGLVIWKVEVPKGTIHVDSHGDILWTGPGQTRRYAYGTGALQWQKSFESIPLTGSNMLANTENGLFLADKKTGIAFQPVNLTPSPVGKLRGVGLKDGKAFLVDGTGRAYGYRGSAPAYSLGYLPVEPNSKFLAVPDGSVIVRLGGTVHTRFDAGFHRSWTQGFQGILDVDADHMFVQKDFPTVLDLNTLSEKLRLAHDDYAARDIGVLINGAVLSVSNRDRAVVSRTDIGTGQMRGLWKSAAKLNGSGRLLMVGFGPNNDPLLYTVRGHYGFLLRLTPAGEIRWTIEVPDGGQLFNPYFLGSGGFTISRDRRRVALNLCMPNRSFEFDITNGKLLRSSAGWSSIHGNNIYRGSQSSTSKYDLATGQELWRVPRGGSISIAADGGVYIGGTKNRAADGSLEWTGPWEMILPLGEFAVGLGWDAMGLLSAKTGHVKWTKDLEWRIDNGGLATPEVFINSGRIALRRPYESRAFELDIETGQGDDDPIWSPGVPDASGRTYRVWDRKLYRSANFFSTSHEELAAFEMYTEHVASDGAGNLYILGWNGPFNSAAKWKL